MTSRIGRCSRTTIEPAARVPLLMARLGPVEEDQRTRRASVMSLVRDLIAAFSCNDDPMLGLYGAFAYDLVFQIEDLVQKRAREADQRDIVLYVPDRLLAYDRATGRGVLLSYEFSWNGKSTAGLPHDTAESAYRKSPRQGFADHAPGETINGGSGFDRIWYISSNAGETLLLSGFSQVEAVLMVNAGGVLGDTTNLSLDASAVATGLLLVGNDGANTITGGASHDIIDGNGGVDTLHGGTGNDRITVRVDEATLDSADGGVAAEGNALVLAGVAAGTVLAYAAARAMESVLAGISPGDAATFAAATAVTMMMALLGSLLPTARAMRIDPRVAMLVE